MSWWIMISMTYHLLSNLTSGQSRLTWLAYIPNNVVLMKSTRFIWNFIVIHVMVQSSATVVSLPNDFTEIIDHQVKQCHSVRSYMVGRLIWRMAGRFQQWSDSDTPV